MSRRERLWHFLPSMFEKRHITGDLSSPELGSCHGAYRLKSRKVWLCWKCVEDIEIGELYIRFTEYRDQGNRINRFHNEWSYGVDCSKERR